MKEKPIEIVKRIPTPNEAPEKVHEDEIIFEEHLLYEKEHQKSNNKMIFSIFMLALASIVGFYGYHFLNNPQNRAEIQDISTNTLASNTASSPITSLPVQNLVKETNNKDKHSVEIKQEKPSVPKEHYTETLALPTLADVEKPKVAQTIAPSVQVSKPVIVETKQETKKEPILVSKTPLNIIEIVHEKPKQIIVEEYEAYEPIDKPSKTIHKKRKTFQYEKIKPTIYRVQKRDSLASISKKFYGSTSEYKRIIRANRRIHSAKTSLRLGEKLIIPRKDGKRTRRFVIIEKGDTLAQLAQQFYGDRTKIKKIIRANYKIKNSRSMLHLGQKVYIPQ